MADKKISALTSATTPLAGTEVLPIVQGGTTVKVAVSDLTAGRNVNVAALTATSTITGDQVLRLLPANVAYGGMLMLYTGQTVNTGARNYGWINSQNAYGDCCLNVSSTLGGDPSAGTTVLSVRNENLTVSTGNLVIGTSGKGIDFSADGSAAGMTSELLNDYEEGTWTPNQGAGIVLVGTFSSSATYTKIGRQVTLVGRINGSTSVANVTNGGVLFSNAPFAPVVSSAGLLINDAQSQTGSGVLATNSVFYITPMSATPTIYFNITYFV